MAGRREKPAIIYKDRHSQHDMMIVEGGATILVNGRRFKRTFLPSVWQKIDCECGADDVRELEEGSGLSEVSTDELT